MAVCKLSVDNNGVVKVPSAALPIICKLQNPPTGVTIVEVEFFPSGSPNATTYTVTGGQSFSIPSLPKGTTGNLFVRIIGNYKVGTTIYVIEDCDNQTQILAITDRAAKYAYAVLEVN